MLARTMSKADEPRWEPFIGRDLIEWNRADLEAFQATRRKPSPKVQQVLDALDAAGVDDVSQLDPDALDALRKNIGLTAFASPLSIAKALKGSKPKPR